MDRTRSVRRVATALVTMALVAGIATTSPAVGAPRPAETSSRPQQTATVPVEQRTSRATPVSVWGRAVPTSTAQVGGNQMLLDATDTTVYLTFNVVPNRLFAMAANGALTHIAGNGSPTPSGDGGSARAAGVGLVRYAVEGPGGDVYLSDGTTIRKVTKATGVITRVAGGGTGGDGPALSANLASITDLEVDSVGRLYVISANSLRRVANGQVTTRYSNHPGDDEVGEPRCLALTDSSSARYTSLTAISIGPSNSVRLAVQCEGLGDALLSVSSTGVVTELESNAATARMITGPATVSSVSQGSNGLCAIDGGVDKQVFCTEKAGALPNEALRVDRVSGLGLAPLTGVVRIARTATNATCALTEDGEVWCWGQNSSGQLGNGTTTSSTDAVRAGTIDDADQLEAYFDVFCVRHLTATVSCWGNGSSGSTGSGVSSSVVSTPTSVAGLSNVSSLATGQPCAVDTGDVWCWGPNFGGRLGVSDAGVGAVSNSNVPLKVPGLMGVESVRASMLYGTTCAIRTDDTVRCWGYEDGGTVFTPTAPVGLPAGVQQLAVGPDVVCALVVGGHVWCWGDNSLGGLGNGTNTTDASWTDPVQAQGLSGVVELSSSSASTCAVDTSGDVWCWGDGYEGAVGDGTDGASFVPSRVVGVSGVARLADNFTSSRCAITASQDLFCWGNVVRRSYFGLTSLSDGRSVFQFGRWLARATAGTITAYAGRGPGCTENSGTSAADVCVADGDLVRPNGALVLGRPLGVTGVSGGSPTTLTLLPRATEAVVDGQSATAVVLEDRVFSIAVKPDGTLLVSQANSSKVHQVPVSGTSAGRVVTVVGDGVNDLDGLGGPALQASIPEVDLATDTRGNVHLLSGDYNTSMRLSGTTLVHVAGNQSNGDSPDGAIATAGPLNPFAIAVADDGSQYLSTYNGAFDRWTIRRVAPDGVLSTVFTSPLGESVPTSMALMPDGSLVVTRTAGPSGNVVERIDIVRRTRTTVAIPAELSAAGALALAVDGASNIVIAVRRYTQNERVVAIAPSGAVRTIDPSTGGNSLAIDRAGNLYVARESTVVKFVGEVHGRPDAPAAPRRPRATSTRRARATVTWALPPGDGFRAITDYIVQRQKVGKSKWATVKDGVSVRRSLVVTGLERNTRYRFRVIAKNQLGRSDASVVTRAVRIT